MFIKIIAYKDLQIDMEVMSFSKKKIMKVDYRARKHLKLEEYGFRCTHRPDSLLGFIYLNFI